MHCDDLADALVFILKNYSDDEHINVGSGVEVSISELAATISSVVGYDAKIIWDKSKPDGIPRKLLDSGRLNELGWQNARSLRVGIQDTYLDFLAR